MSSKTVLASAALLLGSGVFPIAFMGGAESNSAPPAQRRVIVQPADSVPGPDRQPDTIFVPSPRKVVDAMLKLANVQPGEVVFDLGSGDGRICITAAKKYQARAYGYEIDPDRVKESLANVKKNKVEHLVTIERRDIFKLDLSGADVVTLWLLPALNAKLIPQLEKMKPGSRIVSHDFGTLEIVKPDKVIEVEAALDNGRDNRSRRIYLWKTPLKKDEKLFRELARELADIGK
jgi:SAM-dependent methyltransferase